MDDNQRNTIAGAILERVIDIHPEKLTPPEVIRELAGEKADAETSEAYERELADLRTVKLIHPGEFAEPTRAALTFHTLLAYR